MIKILEEKIKLFNYELYLLHAISKAIKETFEERKILNITLTALTANCALGLSRAAIFYYDKGKKLIYGKEGIGPFDEKEAGEIWTELGKMNLSLEEYFKHDLEYELTNQKFPRLIREIVINLDELPENDYFKKVIVEKNFFHLKDIKEFANLPNDIKKLIASSELLIMPLFSSKDILGIIMADNAFHNNPIKEPTVLFISLLSIQTGIALENAFIHNLLEQQLGELRELHETMKQLQEEIIKKEKLSTIGKMASYFIHEIKNPIVTIGGFAKKISEENDLSTIHRDANIIFKEMQKLEQILNKLSTFTLLVPSKMERLNLLDVINEVIDVFELEFTKKNISIQIDVPKDLSLKGEKVQIFEVFFNLISNSIENMDTGIIKISAGIENDILRIIVQDNGRGIPQENLPYVTQPFFSTKIGGFGLGLYIVSSIIENYGGRLEITSVEKEGTTVKIYFPV